VEEMQSVVQAVAELVTELAHLLRLALQTQAAVVVVEEVAALLVTAHQKLAVRAL
jgi:hypothetical protein